MGRMILLKLQPNQDVTEALERALRTIAIRRAHIRGAVGSLVEAVIERHGSCVRIAGPGLEIAGLSGCIDSAGGTILSGYVCSTDTAVQHGRFLRGRNAVGITFEVVLEAGE